jgi:hypothetical protein
VEPARAWEYFETMSLVIALCVPLGIVLAGDTRMTHCHVDLERDPVTGEERQSDPIVLGYSDGAQKVFLAQGRFGIGAFGEWMSNDALLQEHMDCFLRDLAASPCASIQELADRLLIYFRRLQPIPKTAFIVVGYEVGEPWIMAVNPYANEIDRLNWNSVTNRPTCLLAPGGHDHVVERLVNEPDSKPDLLTMILADAVEYARHLISTTAEQMQRNSEPPGVGGHIDRLVVTLTGAYWVPRVPCSTPANAWPPPARGASA